MRQSKSVRRTNVLIVKDDIGKPKPNTRKLPADGFTYGKPDRKDPEDCRAGKS